MEQSKCSRPLGDWDKSKHPRFSASVRNRERNFFLSNKPIETKRLRKIPADEREPQNFRRWKADG